LSRHRFKDRSVACTTAWTGLCSVSTEGDATGGSVRPSMAFIRPGDWCRWMGTVSVSAAQSPNPNSLTESRFIPSNPLASLRDIRIDNPPTSSRRALRRVTRQRSRPEAVTAGHRSTSHARVVRDALGVVGRSVDFPCATANRFFGNRSRYFVRSNQKYLERIPTLSTASHVLQQVRPAMRD